MFELGRELRRFFTHAPPRDGLAGGDAALLELMDLNLLRAETAAADVAAGRIGERDRAQRLIEASVVWRELARRTGDAAALRKSASCAEHAAQLAKAQPRSHAHALALCQQAQSALVGADLFGEESLTAAAEFLLGQTPSTPETEGLRAALLARRAAPAGDLVAVQSALAGYERLLSGPHARRRSDLYAGARLRIERAEFLAQCGARLHESRMIDAALTDLGSAAAVLDGAYHPVSLARACEARGIALIRRAELTGDLAPALESVDVLVSGVELIGPDHSPLDWARLHHSLGLGLLLLAEAGESEPAFDRALQSFGKALVVLNESPNLALRSIVAQDRAACLVRRAEIGGDAFALDEAEAVLRGELGALKTPPDPIAWGVLQLNLARIYLAQAAARGSDRGERARAGDALVGAFEVFAEKGLATLTATAEAQLQKLREGTTASR